MGQCLEQTFHLSLESHTVFHPEIKMGNKASVYLHKLKQQPKPMMLGCWVGVLDFVLNSVASIPAWFTGHRSSDQNQTIHITQCFSVLDTSHMHLISVSLCDSQPYGSYSRVLQHCFSALFFPRPLCSNGTRLTMLTVAWHGLQRSTSHVTRCVVKTSSPNIIQATAIHSLAIFPLNTGSHNVCVPSSCPHT